MIVIKAYQHDGIRRVANDAACFSFLLQEEDVASAIEQMLALEKAFSRNIFYQGSLFMSNASTVTSRFLERKLRQPDGSYGVICCDSVKPKAIDKDLSLPVGFSIKRGSDGRFMGNWETLKDNELLASELWLTSEMQGWIDTSCRARKNAYQAGVVSALH